MAIKIPLMSLKPESVLRINAKPLTSDEPSEQNPSGLMSDYRHLSLSP